MGESIFRQKHNGDSRTKQETHKTFQKLIETSWMYETKKIICMKQKQETRDVTVYIPMIYKYKLYT